MDLLIMTALVFLAMRLVGAVVLALADRPPRRRPAPPAVADPPAVARPFADPCLSSVTAIPPARAADPEQQLFDRLRAGRISREQYRDAVAAIARRDTAAASLRAPGG
jgi:hypothetical protein